MPTVLLTTFDPASYNSQSGTDFTLGTVYSNGDGNEYRFVNFQTAGMLGAVMCVYNAQWGYVCGANRTTQLVGTPVAIMPVGIAKGTVTVGWFGFVQVTGYAVFISGTSTLGREQMATAVNETGGDATASIARVDGCFGKCIVATSGGFATAKLSGLV